MAWELNDEEEYLEELNADDEEFPSTSTSNSDQNELLFVQTLEAVGKILLNKSQTPNIKVLKKSAANKMCHLLMEKCTISYTPDQIIKKVANLKQRVKKKADMKATGNNPIHLKTSEQLLLDLLNAKSNPSITPITCGFEVGIPSTSKTISPDVEIVVSSTPPQSSAKRRRISETSNNNDLQATVLEKQLQLIELQYKMLKAQEEIRSQEQHAKKMAILEMKEKLLAEEINSIDKNRNN